MIPIEALPLPPSEADLASLATLLVEAVDGGAAVSFLAPLPHGEAVAWWRQACRDTPPRTALLVVRGPSGLLGTVSLRPSWAPNQPHRADVTKLIVGRDARGRGIARALMRRVEAEARAAGFRLLTLDTQAGSPADYLYQTLGWTRLGVIPGFALDADGAALNDAALFYKTIAAGDGAA